MRDAQDEFIRDISEGDVEISHLLVIYIDGLDSAMWFTNYNKKLIFYDDNYIIREFMPIPFKLGTIQYSTSTDFPKMTMTLSNITRDFSELVMNYDIENSDIIIYEVSRRKLDNPMFRIELFRGCFDKPKMTETNFEIDIVAGSEVKGVKLPRRIYMKRCQNVFGLSPDCPYAKTSDQTCNKTYVKCLTYDMTNHFSGFRKIATSSDVRGVNG